MGKKKEVVRCRLFKNMEQVNEYRTKIIDNTEKYMTARLQDSIGLEFLRKIKFDKHGYDPLFEEPTNFIEQTNQTWTYLVCLSAVEYFLKEYPGKSFYVNFGTKSGYDVVSEDESIICECFATTVPNSNEKLEKDTLKVFSNENAKEKYIIFYASEQKPKQVANKMKKYPGVKILPLDTI